ncbi:hypothetical protein SLE2022_309310 [Rubroshorea leprosula]
MHERELRHLVTLERRKDLRKKTKWSHVLYRLKGTRSQRRQTRFAISITFGSTVTGPPPSAVIVTVPATCFPTDIGPRETTLSPPPSVHSAPR